MILCDTNIIIESFKSNQTIVAALQKIGKENIVVSAVTVGELFFGAIDKRELLQIKKTLQALFVLPMGVASTEIFLELMENYSLSHKLSVPDAMIAATALHYDLPLFTLNVKDFRFIKNLKLHPIS